MTPFERRIRGLGPVTRDDVRTMLRGQHGRVLRSLKDKRLNEIGVRLLERSAYAYLIDSIDVERDGCTPLSEYLG